MKFQPLFFILFLTSFCATSFAQYEIDIVDPYEMKVSRSRQADTFYFTEKSKTAIKTKSDTLRSYDVFLEERPTPFGKAYMCNGKEVTKQKFYDYKLLWNASGACKPCLLYTYNDKDELKYAAFQYEDCLCGSYIEYYPDGARKCVGQFKENTTGNWQNMRGRDLCNVRDGLWTYYYENGMVEKTEQYENGKLKSVTTAVTGNAKNTSDKNETEEGTTAEKKGVFKKTKEKSKTIY